MQTGLTPGETLENRVRVVTPEGLEDDPSNNEAAATVDVAMPYVDFKIVKGANRTSALRGESVTYMIRVTNHGPAISTGAEAFEMLPLGLHVPEESFSITSS